MYSFTADAARLASVRRASTGTRYRYRTEDGLAIDLPDPALVAAGLTSETDLRRRSKDMLDGSVPVAVPDLFEGITAALRALPERADAGDPYVDLVRAAAAAGPIFMDRYIPAVARAFRETLKPADTASREQRPSKPKAALQAERRARRKAEEYATARYWFDLAKSKGVHVFLPGEWAPAPDVFAAVVKSAARRVALAADGEIAPEVGDGPEEWRVPRKSVVYAVADEYLTRKRSSGGYVYGTPA